MTPSGKSCRFVRACALSGCQVEFELNGHNGQVIAHENVLVEYLNAFGWGEVFNK